MQEQSTQPVASYYPSADEVGQGKIQIIDELEPCHSVVTAEHADGTVDLAIQDHFGGLHNKSNVVLAKATDLAATAPFAILLAQ